MIIERWKKYRESFDSNKKKSKHVFGLSLSLFIISLFFIFLLISGGIIATNKCYENKLLSRWGMIFIIIVMILFFPMYGWIISILMIIIWLTCCRKKIKK